MFINDNGTLSYNVLYLNSRGHSLTGSNVINPGGWHHVAFVKKSDGTMLCYIDGQEDATHASAAGFSTPPTTAKTFLGAYYSSNSTGGGAVNNFKGKIDNLRI